ncbi:hypothetical protein H310_00148 [Aphanomyces invadans]|uniref:Cyclic nucleotide-binding domain-containing protein n=1 Tax=Aphanomyces invadans TaxID=157072 RepID=A0A024USV8_9STRA|nr:hypothetical protein H310_00148 [Aphanomyces invadans]ETW09611.1 hypothetical protein H310_00148 [Aphanomyces invadans]|eukprot:XP_008861022.1 hypothetical protein H310_00148 [Aphanomyces invadans]
MAVNVPLKKTPTWISRNPPWRRPYGHRIASSDAITSVSVRQVSGVEAVAPLTSLPPKRSRLMRIPSRQDISMTLHQWIQDKLMWSRCIPTWHVSHFIAFDPTSTKIAIWHTFLAAIVLYDALVVPLLVCFDQLHHGMCNNTALLIVMDVADLAFVLDVYVQLFTGYFDNGDLVIAPASTRRRYTRSMHFPLDLLALIPLVWLPIEDWKSTGAAARVSTLCGALRANKLLRLRRLPQYTIAFDKVFARYFKFCKIVKVVVALVVFCHVMGCLYVLFGIADDDNKWKLEAHVAHEPLTTQYMAAISWVLGIVSHVAEGVIPRTAWQTLYMYTVQLGGFTLFVYICGTLFMISKCDANNREQFDAKVNQLRYVLSFHRVPAEIQDHAIEFLEHGFFSGESQDKSNMQLLCPSIAKEVKYTLLKGTVTAVPFFKTCSIAFIRAIIDVMETRSLPTNYYVCRTGDHGEDMYFVQSGVLAVLIDFVKVRELRKGAYFGELSLFTNQVRTADVATATFCILHRLSRVHITRVLNAYPEAEGPILECVERISEELELKAPKAGELARRGSLQYSDTSLRNCTSRSSLLAPVDSRRLDSGVDQKTSAAIAAAMASPIRKALWTRVLLSKPLDRRKPLRCVWVLAIMVVTIYNLIMVPLVCAFDLMYSVTVLLFNTLADAVLWADIYAKLNLSFVMEAEHIVDPKQCALHYIRTDFAFDVACAFPWWILYPPSHEPWRFIRLFRLLNFLAEFEEVATFVHINSRHRIAVLGMGLLLSYHVAGCLAHTYTQHAGFGDTAFGWLPPKTMQLTAVANAITGDIEAYQFANGTAIPPDSPDVMRILLLQYTRAVQYGAVCITNLGRPYEPVTFAEYMFAFTLMLIGMLLVSIIIDEVQKRVTASAVEQMEFLSTRSRILHFLKRQKAPADLHRRVLAFLDFSWSAHRGADINTLVSELPSTMQRDIYGYICGPILEMIAHLDHVSSVYDQVITKFLDNVTIQLYGQGEMIYRLGDIGDAMYMLLQGHVATYVATQLHELNQGDLFGLASLNFAGEYIAHTDNAIARSACVVAIVSRDTVAALNQIYPRFADGVKKRCLRVSRQATMTAKAKTENAAHPQAINPDSNMSVMWETFLFFGIAYQVIMVPYYMAFGFSKSNVAAVDVVSIVLEVSFLVDIVLKTRTGYMDYGNKVMDVPVIRRRYLRSTAFVLDLLAVLPTNLVNAFVDSPRSEAWNINKLLRLFKLSSQIDHLERQYFTIITQIRVSKLVFYIYLLAHFVGCTWYNFASNESTLLNVINTDQFGADVWLPGNDIATANTNHTNAFKLAKVMYWGVGMLFGFHPGGHPTTVIEYMFTMVVQTVGVFLLAYVVGNLLDIVQVTDGNSRLFYSNLNYVRKLLRYFSFSDDVQSKIQYFYFYRLFHSIHEEHILVRCLPPSLTADIRMFLLTPMLNKVPFLQDNVAGASVTRILVSQMSQMLVTRDEIICRQHDVGREMYFVFTGCLDVFISTSTAIRFEGNLGIKVHEITDGSFFGEKALFSNEPRNATIKARTFCTLYKLSLAHLHSIFSWHPEWKAKVLDIVQHLYEEQAARLQQVTGTQSIAQPVAMVNGATSTIVGPLQRSGTTKLLVQTKVVPAPPVGNVDASPSSSDSDRSNSAIKVVARPVAVALSLRDLIGQIHENATPLWKRWGHQFLHVEIQSPLYCTYLTVLCFSILHVALSVPFMLTFGHQGLNEIAVAVVKLLNVVVDVVFAYDIWFKRHLVETTLSREFYERNDVQQTSVALDVVAIIPLDYICDPFFAWSPLLRFNRFLKLRQLSRTISEIHRFSMSYELNRLKLLALYYFIVSYWTACAYFGITFVDGFATQWNTSLPTADFQLHDHETAESEVHRLLRCMYFAGTLYTGAGIVYEPTTMLQYSFILVMSVFGVFVMGYVIGEGSMLCIYLIQNEVDFKINQMNVMEFLSRKRLTRTLHGRVRGYMAYWWTTHQGVAFQSILEQLPPKIRSQSSLQIARLSLSRFSMRYLRPLSKDTRDHDLMICSLAQRVVFEGYPKGEAVVVQGNLGQHVYFVSKGELISLSTLSHFVSSRYSEGQYFGDDGFLGGAVCHCSIVTARACDLLSLSAEDFVLAMESHPRYAEALRLARDVTEHVAYKSMCINDTGEVIVRQTIEEQAATLKHFPPMTEDQCSLVFKQFLRLFVSSHAVKTAARHVASTKSSRRSLVSCQKCWKRLGTVQCNLCQLTFCGPCCSQTHASKELRGHLDSITTTEIFTPRPSLLSARERRESRSNQTDGRSSHRTTESRHVGAPDKLEN